MPLLLRRTASGLMIAAALGGGLAGCESGDKAKDAVDQGVQDAKDAGKNAADDAKQAGEDAVQGAKDTAKDAGDKARDAVDDATGGDG